MFTSELPDLQTLIQRLNLLDENVNAAVRQALKSGAEIIMKEQKSLIDGEGTKHELAEAISCSGVYSNSENELAVTTGYQSSAFEESDDGKNLGIIGMTYEFGRPGQSDRRGWNTMWQTRNGKNVEVYKGKIEPIPHIRRGFDNKIEEAANLTSEALEKEVAKVFD